MEPGSLAEVVDLQGDIRVPQSGGAHDDDDRRVGLRGGVLLAGVGFQQLLPLTPMRWWPHHSSAPGLRLGAGEGVGPEEGAGIVPSEASQGWYASDVDGGRGLSQVHLHGLPIGQR